MRQGLSHSTQGNISNLSHGVQVKEIIKNMKNLTVKAIHARGGEMTDKDKSKEEISIHFLYAIQNRVDGEDVDHMLERIVALSESVTKSKDVEI